MEVTTLAATNVRSTQATLHAQFTPPATSHEFQWKYNSTIYSGYGYLDDTNTFWGSAHSIPPDTTVQFRARVYVIGEGYYYGEWLEFHTNMTVVCTTDPASGVHSTLATFNGHWTKDDEIISGNYGWFDWKIGEGGSVNTVQAINTGTPFHRDRTGLIPDTIYYYKAKVNVQDYGIIYGDWVKFRTGVPIVTTLPAEFVGNTISTLKGEIIPGEDENIERGFYWYKIIHPYTSFSHWVVNVAENKIRVTLIMPYISTGSQIKFRSANILPTGLEQYTVYYAIKIDDETLKVASTLSNANAGIAIDLKNGGVGNHRIFAIETWQTPTHIKEEIGSGGGVYSKALEDLEPDTHCYFRAYGKFILYGTSTEYFITGEWLEFTTLNEIPTVTTQIAIDIEAMSVTGNGTIEDFGDLETFCKTKGFDLKYEFSGTLAEYYVWKGYGFAGDITLDEITGLWSGTLTRSDEESGVFSTGAFTLLIINLICDKTFEYRAKSQNDAGWGYGVYLEFITDELLLRKACTCGVFTILLCAYVKSIPSGSVIKRRGFRWGVLDTAQEYDIHEDGDFSASAMIGPVDTISFVNSADDNVYDTIVDSAGGFLSAGFEAGKFIDVSATGAINPVNEGQFKIISVTADTITVNVRNTLVSEEVTGVTIVDLFALYIVDLDPETDYYSVAYVAIEDSLGNWTVQEGDVASATTIVNPFDMEGYDRVEFYKPEREQNYKKITRKIEAEIIAEQQYIDIVGGRRFLPIENHLIQTKENAETVGTNYKDRFKNIKSRMEIEYPTPAPFQREDTLDIGFGRIRFKENDKGVVNFMPDGEGLMLFRYRMVMVIRKIDMGYAVSKDDVDYIATMELEEA